MSSATLFSVALLAGLGGMSRALVIFLPEDPGTTLVTELDGPRDFFYTSHELRIGFQCKGSCKGPYTLTQFQIIMHGIMV